MNLQFTSKELRRWRRARTTMLNDFVVTANIKESQNIIERNSPTRCVAPQPVGLVFQKPLQPAVLPPYAIWNPEPSWRKIRSRYPKLVSHLKMTNFSCGEPMKHCPWNSEIKPPLIEHCENTTSRFSYRHPGDYPAWARPSKLCSKGAVVVHASQGIVPNIFPKVNSKTNKDSPMKKLKTAGPGAHRAVAQYAVKTI